MTNTHTPAPWVVSESEKKCLAIFPGNEHGRPRALCSIAWVQSWNDTADDAANAAFICRAVNCHDELLDVLVRVMKEIEHGGASGTALRAMTEDAHAAIAKARGQS